MEEIARVHQQLYGLRMQCMQAETQLNALRTQIQHAEQHLSSLELQQRQSDALLSATTQAVQDHCIDDVGSPAVKLDPTQWKTTQFPLPLEDYKRYGRQMILPEIGAAGQTRLRQARVLIVGVGGLGCPAAAYLAGAGIGTIGLVDGDTVEMSNLHRQVAHSTGRVGVSKVESAYTYLKELNPTITYEQYPEHLTSAMAVSLFEKYDLVLDCTDHPTTRYLISDACVLTGRPLVSASALKTEGQLIVLNNPPRAQGDISGGPCYRCIFPKPPPSDTVQSCGEGGILGPVVGVMGVLQALEAIKVLTATPSIDVAPKATMLMFSAYSSPQFRSIKMRPRRSDCAVCSGAAVIDRAALENGSMDYATFCGWTGSSASAPDEQRLAASTLSQMPYCPRAIIIDTRDRTQYDICALQNTINIPWTGDNASWYAKARECLEAATVPEVLLICRHGNDSQTAANLLRASELGQRFHIRDIKDGFDAWRRDVDPDWPEY